MEKTLYNTLTRSHTHSYPDGRGCHARCQPLIRSKFGVQYLPQGCFDMQQGGGGDSNQWPSDYSIYLLSYCCPMYSFLEKNQNEYAIIHFAYGPPLPVHWLGYADITLILKQRHSLTSQNWVCLSWTPILQKHLVVCSIKSLCSILRQSIQCFLLLWNGLPTDFISPPTLFSFKNKHKKV